MTAALEEAAARRFDRRSSANTTGKRQTGFQRGVNDDGAAAYRGVLFEVLCRTRPPNQHRPNPRWNRTCCFLPGPCPREVARGMVLSHRFSRANTVNAAAVRDKAGGTGPEMRRPGRLWAPLTMVASPNTGTGLVAMVMVLRGHHRTRGAHNRAGKQRNRHARIQHGVGSGPCALGWGVDGWVYGCPMSALPGTRNCV